jgi:COP9 signalosome complex subunit 8
MKADADRTRDRPPARYALSRLPEGLSATPLAKSLWGLVASAWDRKHANVYSRSGSLFKLVDQADFFDRKLATVIAAMVTTFVGEHSFQSLVILEC